jgi:hypothetical protein
MNKKFPRQDVVDRQAELVEDTLENVAPEALENLRGGLFAAPMYGIFPFPRPKPVKAC